MFLNHTAGCTYMTMDKALPFQMEEFQVNNDAGPGGYMIKWDSPRGILVVWCLKYSLTGTKGMTFSTAGLMFLQLLSSQQHYAHLWSAAEIMKGKMADFGAQVATSGQSSSSSASQPAPLSLALQPTVWV